MSSAEAEVEGIASAHEANLVYSHTEEPGITRRRRGRGFSYQLPDGEVVDDPRVLKRIRELVIPPAWRDVWIAPSPRAHIQATGRDQRGRKQYIYHPEWRRVRDESKFHRMLIVGESLPRLRKQVDNDMALRGLPRTKVIATLVRLLEITLIRIGNDEYARMNQSFGLTTLRLEHSEVRGSTVRFAFNGKGGKEHQVEVNDRRAANVMRRCEELSGQTLFSYRDADGDVHAVKSDDVNAYLSEATGVSCSAKDLRTWHASARALELLLLTEPPTSATDARSKISATMKEVASLLGNTPAVCRKSYVHPEIPAAFAEGTLEERTKRRSSATGSRMLSDAEKALLRFLRTTEPG